MQALISQQWNVIFMYRNCDARLLKRCKKEGIEILSVSKTSTFEQEMQCLETYLNGTSTFWFVLDGYHLDEAYQQYFADKAPLFLLLDDNHEHILTHVDLLLNQNIHAPDMDYPPIKNMRLLLGPKYALLRDEFLQKKEHRSSLRSSPSLLLSLGGSDVENLTGLLIAWLQEISQPFFLNVVIGNLNKNLAYLEKWQQEDHIIFHEHPEDMASLMAASDIAITSGGSTCLELAYLGVPAVIWVVAENQAHLARELHEKTAFNLGWFSLDKKEVFLQWVSTLLNDQAKHQEMASYGQQLVDGKGRERVVTLMSKMLKE